MNTLQRILLACFAVLTLAACSASELRDVTAAGMTIAGRDAEQTERVSGAVGQVAGSLGPMPFETEYAIGGGIALKSFQERGALHPNDDLQRYVNLVGLSLVRQTARRDFPFAFAVIERDDANAWAAPGGYVFVTTGALRQMETEAQLAGVLAHEIAHVTQEHMVTMLRRSQLFAGLAEGAGAAFQKDSARLSQVSDIGTDIIFNKGLDRNMELDADRVGIEIAALTGYNPRGLVEFLDNLGRGSSTNGGWLLATHPPVSRRTEELRRLLNTEFAGVTGADGRERFQKNVTQVLSR